MEVREFKFDFADAEYSQRGLARKCSATEGHRQGCKDNSVSQNQT
jgi:hypothetical protein